MAGSQPNKKRVKTPSFFQMEMVECGAAALGMILGYYGCHVTLDQLRHDCGVSRDGCKASNIVRAAQKYGLEAEGYKLTVNELDELELPFIAFWRFNHFVVIEGFGQNKIFINDPAMGHRSISLEEFEKEYSGIALDFTPTDTFQKMGKRPQITLQLLKRLRHQFKPLAFLFLCGFFLILMGIIIPVFGKIFVDNYLVEQTQSILKLLTIGMLITSLVKFALSFIQNYYLNKFENKLSIIFNKNFIWHVIRLPLRFFTQRHTGDITYRVALNRTIASFIANAFIQSSLDIILIITYLGLMLYFDVTLAVMVSLLAVVNMFLFYNISKIRRDKSLLMSVELGNYYAQCYSGLRIIETIKASGSEQEIFSKIIGSQVKVANATHELNSKTMVISLLPKLLNLLATVIILSFGALKIMNGEMTAGTLVAIQSIIFSFIGPLNMLVLTAGHVQEMVGLIAKVDDVLEYKTDQQANLLDFAMTEQLIQEEKSKLSGLIEVKNLSFGFNVLEKPILSEINFTIFPGEHVAIVGTSGSGKSTLAKLIANLYIPWGGEISIDGKKLNEVNKIVLANTISMVEQDNILFNSTLKKNITMWDNTITLKAVVQSAKDASIHKEISLRPQGYDTIADENGANFSGGERQRIDIARALATNPNLLILDEATSELDPITENVIYDNIRGKGCTTIIVAHRLNTVRNADKIIVLEKGKIVQMGAHDELIHVSGHYQHLMSTS